MPPIIPYMDVVARDARVRAVLFPLIAILTHGPTLARQNGPVSYPTIEYFVADGDLVVRGKVTPGPVVLTIYNDPDEDKPNEKPTISRQFQKYSVRIEETLRRDRDVVPEDPTGRAIDFLVEQQGPDERRFGDQPDREMLLSLRATSGWQPDEKVGPELCPWIVRFEWGDNQDHLRYESHWWAYDLNSHHLPAYDISGARITRTADILPRARAAAAFPRPPRADEDVAYFSPGRSRPHARILPIDQSDHDLYAPVDSRLEEQVRLWLPGIAESDRKRQNVLNAVWKIRTPHSQETVRMIQHLATTAPPTPGGWEDEGRWRIPAYDVRRWARRVLLRWRVPPGE